MKRPPTLDDFVGFRDPAFGLPAALSSSGDLLAFPIQVVSEKATSHEADFLETGAPSKMLGVSLWLKGLEGDDCYPLLADEEERSWGPSWSPQGSLLAFLSDHDGSLNLWLWDPRTREAKSLPEVSVLGAGWGFDTPRWQPDGRHLWVRLRPEGWVRPRGRWGPELLAARAERSVEVFASRKGKIFDGAIAGTVGTASDVGLVNVETSVVERVQIQAPVGRFLPSPDGKLLACLTVPRNEDVSDLKSTSDLVLFSISDGQTQIIARSLEGWFPQPAWSPDSTRLAYIHRNEVVLLTAQGETLKRLALDPVPDPGFLLWEPDGSALLVRDVGGRLWRFATEEDDARQLQLPEGRSSPMVLSRHGTSWSWSPDAESCTVLTFERSSKRSEVWRVALDGGSPDLLLAEDCWLVGPVSDVSHSAGDISGDGRWVVYAREDEASPTELWISDSAFSERRQLTDLNSHFREVKLGRSQLVTWAGPDGKPCQGALLLPVNHNDDQRLSTIMWIYPNATRSDFLHQWNPDSSIIPSQILASRGFAVFFPDLPALGTFIPTRFQMSAILHGAINELDRLGIGDPERVGVMGQSGGGASVNRLVTETSRFRAAVGAAGFSNPSSQYGHLSFGPDGFPQAMYVPVIELIYGGPPWQVPENYFIESAVFNADRVETPLLLIHGTEDDMQVQEAHQMFVCLYRQGKEVTLAKYHGEGHVPFWFSAKNRRDVVDRVIAWFEEHLGTPSPGPTVEFRDTPIRT